MTSQRLLAPWSVVRTEGGWVVTDSVGRALAYTYGRDDGGTSYHGLTVDQARRVAAGIARLPELMRFKASG